MDTRADTEACGKEMMSPVPTVPQLARTAANLTVSTIDGPRLSRDFLFSF
jgi:hypothetical protein